VVQWIVALCFQCSSSSTRQVARYPLPYGRSSRCTDQERSLRRNRNRDSIFEVDQKTPFIRILALRCKHERFVILRRAAAIRLRVGLEGGEPYDTVQYPRRDVVGSRCGMNSLSNEALGLELCGFSNMREV
jgi:hypothetical protein